MSSVGGGINQHIIRLSFQSSLYDRLQIFIFDLKILKAQIIHINNKLVISVFDLGDHLI